MLKISENGSCCLTLNEKHRLRMFENRVLRRIFGLKREEITRIRKKNCIMRSFITCTHDKIL
jgi:hypothetical protein